MLTTKPTKEGTAENKRHNNNNTTHITITQNIITHVITTYHRNYTDKSKVKSYQLEYEDVVSLS